jgi:peptidoglycan hydrolase-like protein with peptidoglycan-binding domain
MLFTTINGVENFGYGFGATTAGQPLVQGRDFNCNSSICYGIGTSNHALFQQLQQTLNQYGKMGLTVYSGGQLVVDGFIGNATVNAARAAAAMALLPSPGTTREAVAANAQILQLGLQNFLGGVGAPRAPVVTSQPTTSPAPPPTSVVTPQGAIITSPTAQPLPQQAATVTRIPNAAGAASSPAAAALVSIAPKEKIPLWIWITGGAVGLIVVGGIGYAILREPSPKPALARRRRRRR